MSITTYTTKSGRVRHRVEVEVGRRLDGSPDRRTKVCDTKREAKRIEHEFEALKMRLGGRSDNMSFEDFTSRYYLPVKRRALRATTMRGYESVINNHLMPTLANVAITDINRLQIQSLLSSRSSNKVAKNTRDMLRQILGEALQMEIIKSNPAAGRFRFPDKRETDQSRTGEWVSDISEHKRMIELATGSVKAILVLGLCFGLRKGEILGLDWKDVNFKERSITIKQTYVQIGGSAQLTAPKTEGSRRTIPMSEYAYCQLKAIHGKVKRIGPVCTSGKGRLSPSQSRDMMQDFVKKNEVPKITAMSLRHSFATAAIRSGVPVELVSKILGHTNITTTYNRYVRPLQKDLNDAILILDKAYLA